jgi:hypothetical protein
MGTKNGGLKSAPPREQAPKQRPAHEIRFGRLKATVWRQESDKGPWFSTVFSRSYRDDGGNWQSSQSFGRDDLLVLAKMCDLADTWIRHEQAALQRDRQPGEDDEPAPY